MDKFIFHADNILGNGVDHDFTGPMDASMMYIYRNGPAEVLNALNYTGFLAIQESAVNSVET
jgi:hypothetical protein